MEQHLKIKIIMKGMIEMNDYSISDKELKRLKRKYNLEKILDYYFECREQTLETIDKDSIPDIKELNLGDTKTPLERIIKYLDQGYNPYFIKVNGRIVHMQFAKDGPTIDECICNIVDREIELGDYLPPGKIVVVHNENE